MEKITGNEPAYAKSAFYHQDVGIDYAQTGLTIRQQFAAMAMQGIMGSFGGNAQMFKMQMEYFAERYPNDTMFVACAKEAVIAADALINALNK